VPGKFDWSAPPLDAVYLPNRFLSPMGQVFLGIARELLKYRISP
jgi:hypothetical protein